MIRDSPILSINCQVDKDNTYVCPISERGAFICPLPSLYKNTKVGTKGLADCLATDLRAVEGKCFVTFIPNKDSKRKRLELKPCKLKARPNHIPYVEKPLQPHGPGPTRQPK